LPNALKKKMPPPKPSAKAGQTIWRRRMLYHERRARKDGYKNIAGIDEAGRGPLAGPVVACALSLKRTRFNCRVDDSKKLTPRMRLIAYDEILEKALFGIGIINEKIIDRINIYNATKRAMRRALESLSVKPDLVLVDGNIALIAPGDKKYITGGDSKSLSIACASIIAKVTRDRIMLKYHEKYPRYGFSRHKGYGTKEHMRLLLKHGPSPIHRRSFNPVKQMVAR